MLSAINLRDRKIVQKFLVSVITDLKLTNKWISLSQICDILEEEVTQLRCLNVKYLEMLAGGMLKEQQAQEIQQVQAQPEHVINGSSKQLSLLRELKLRQGGPGGEK